MKKRSGIGMAMAAITAGTLAMAAPNTQLVDGFYEPVSTGPMRLGGGRGFKRQNQWMQMAYAKGKRIARNRKASHLARKARRITRQHLK